MPPPWQADSVVRRLPALRARNRIKEAVRRVFRERLFDEVEVPGLQPSPGNETHVAGFATQYETAGFAPQTFFLHGSPEFGCKKLLAAGLERIVSFGPAWRNGERGRLHHPEFTMLEWYRAGADLDHLRDDCVALLRAAADAIGSDARLRYRGSEVDPREPIVAISVVDAFRLHAGLDLAEMLPEMPGGRERFAAAARDLGLRVTPDDSWSDLFSKILSDRVEPRLGMARVTALTRYPASEAALARLCPDDPRFAERFELYACGVELANAFRELRDPVEQRRRFQAAEAERLRLYGRSHPIDEDFLDALAVMPDASGIALGFDRLVMMLVGADRLDDVLWLPIDCAGP